MAVNACSSAVADRLEGLSGAHLLQLASAAVRGYAAAGGDGDGLAGLALEVTRAAAAAGQPEATTGEGDAGDELVEELAAWHRVEAAAYGRKLRVLAAIEQGEVWSGRAMSCAGLLVERLGVGHGEARALLDAARAVARMPRVAARLAGGGLAAGHVAEVSRAVKRLDRLADDPGGQDASGDEAAPDARSHGEARDGAVAALDATVGRLDLPDHTGDRGADGCEDAGDGDGLTAADADGGGGHAAPVVERRRVREVVQAWEREHGGDALARRERRIVARRSVWVGRQGGDVDEMGGIRGDLTPMATAKARTVLHALARQHAADDPRSFAQRCHDALERVFDLALASGELPDVAGEQPRVLLTVTPEALHDHPAARPGTLDGYGEVSNETARQICCDAEVTAVALGDGHAVLNVGRDRRRPNRAQRRAAFARDQGCIGCGAPVASCQIHHVDWPWHERGRTDIDRLVAVCWVCHAKIHHLGWQVARRADGRFVLHAPDRVAGRPDGSSDGTEDRPDRAPPREPRLELDDHHRRRAS